MKISTRLQIVTAASAALVVIIALLLYWSHYRLATATKANALADEIVNSIFERSMILSDYLRKDTLRSKDQLLAKQSQVSDLMKKAASVFNAAVDRKIISSMLKNNDESGALFEQIVTNRESVKYGMRQQAQASEIENRLAEQLLLKSYDTIADTRELHEISRELIASTQRIAGLVSLVTIASIALFVIIAVWSLSRIIGKGIATLQQGAAAIGTGNLQHTIPITGEDEFAEVAGAFNTMSGKLVQSHAVLEQEICERKRAADEIEQLNRELNQTVAQLQAANRELEAFSYSVSHDLRAPLRAMGGFSEALVEDYGDRLEGEAREYLNEIVIGSRHMAQLIDGLLTLSRSTRGELHRDRVDLTAMAEHIRLELEQSEPGRRVKWQIEAGLSGLGDGHMIELVMRNLLANAWKYTAGAAEPLIRVYAEWAENERFICVSDNGAGFDMAHAEKLFQPFQRLHRQEEFPGIGIGLATAQRIVHRHGGVIHAAGAPHMGATFKFSLPYGDEQWREEQ